jgi:hypothetical protein
MITFWRQICATTYRLQFFYAESILVVMLMRHAKHKEMPLLLCTLAPNSLIAINSNMTNCPIRAKDGGTLASTSHDAPYLTQFDIIYFIYSFIEISNNCIK